MKLLPLKNKYTNSIERTKMDAFSYLIHFIKCNFTIDGEKGQSTAEYSLVILGAAAIALLLLTWAGSTGSITSLFESVISRVTSKSP